MDLGSLARATGECTGAELDAICRKATMLAIREYLSVSRPGPDTAVASAPPSAQAASEPPFGGFIIRMTHFQQAQTLMGKA